MVWNWNDMQILFYYMLGFLGLNSEDYILSSYPRSGSTWLRFVLCHTLDLEESLPGKIDYEKLDEVMVELGGNNLLESWPYATLPRIVKTHKPYFRIFRRSKGAIGLIRDPRDVMVSYFHFKKDRKKQFRGDFSTFIRDHRFGLVPWFEHYQSWHLNWDFVLQYEALRKDTLKEVRKLYSWLGVHVSSDSMKKAVQRSRLENVRKLEDEYKDIKKEQARMARSGETEQWRTYFQAGDLAYFDDMKQRYSLGDFPY